MSEIMIKDGMRVEGITPAYSVAPSPFLPGTTIQYAWDSTSIGYLKTCPRLYQYVMIDGYGSQEESIHLRFGQEYHQALQEYDISRAAGIPHNDSLHTVIRALLERTVDFAPDQDTKAGKYKNRESLVRSIINHADFFKDDPAETLILENGKPAVELSFSFELEWGPVAAELPKMEEGLVADGVSYAQPYVLSGHLDRVVNFQDTLFVMDYKTTTTTPSSYFFDQFEPNNQMTLYTLASQIILASPIKGVIIEAGQILLTPPYNRFVRGFTYRTPDQLEEWTADLANWLRLAEGYATQGYWPQNDTACDKFGGCRFRKVCSKSPQVRDVYLQSSFTKLAPEDRWNPLRPR